MPTTAERVEAFLRRRQRMLAALARVNAWLADWREPGEPVREDAAYLLASEYPRPVQSPMVTRASLETLRAMVLEELAKLER